MARFLAGQESQTSVARRIGYMGLWMATIIKRKVQDAPDDMEDVIQGYYYQTTNLYHFLSPPSTIPSLLSSVKFCLLRPDLSTPSLPPPLKALYNIRRGTTAKSSGILKLSLMRFASATLVVVVACQNGLTRK